MLTTRGFDDKEGSMGEACVSKLPKINLIPQEVAVFMEVATKSSGGGISNCGIPPSVVTDDGLKSMLPVSTFEGMADTERMIASVEGFVASVGISNKGPLFAGASLFKSLGGVCVDLVHGDIGFLVQSIQLSFFGEVFDPIAEWEGIPV
jgi:hypothetical protein